ncbi:hypothetical protein H4R24_004296 [Coemansia sp. RSA 988]|nr:hypothetical protein H4R24_004296 [Coemansia sp. RSA 988]
MDDYSTKLENKIAIVTGAASGFGKLLTEKLVEYNAKVLLVDVNPSIEQQSKLLNQEKPGSTHWEVCDLCQTHLIQGLFDNAVKYFGRVDFVINNAGIANECSLFSQPDHKELDRIVRLNLQAPMEATRVAVRYFKDSQRQGVVVNTASVGGLLPVSIMESYGTTKAGLIFFTTTCRSLSPQIRVNAIAPYFADTPLVANNRLVGSYPLVQQIGLMNPHRVIRAMLKAMCDETLAGDTLIVAMGSRTEKLTFYDDLTVQVTSYIASGTFNKYASLFNKFFTRTLNSTLGFLRNRNASKDA